jgi:electron transfer flavoprotein alpha subunit
MATILLIAEQAQGQLKKATLHALTAAEQLAEKNRGEIQAVVVGEGAFSAAKDLSAYVPVVHVVEGEAFARPLAETHSSAAAQLANAVAATDIVIAASAYGKDIAPRIAARLSAGIASDVLGIVSGNQFKRAMWAGNAVATVEVLTPVRVVSVRATEFAPAQKRGATGTTRAFPATALVARTKFLEFNQLKSARPELTEASAVVSGGRGTKGDFKPIEQLADLLGAAIGASRAVVDAGWQPNDLQVGQTGKVVAPKLYVAAGISGAIQHVAGMKGSKTIVAINKDPEAPIFQVADYGLVADLFTALPELSEEVKKLK